MEKPKQQPRPKARFTLVDKLIAALGIGLTVIAAGVLIALFNDVSQVSSPLELP